MWLYEYIKRCIERNKSSFKFCSLLFSVVWQRLCIFISNHFATAGDWMCSAFSCASHISECFLCLYLQNWNKTAHMLYFWVIVESESLRYCFLLETPDSLNIGHTKARLMHIKKKNLRQRISSLNQTNFNQINRKKKAELHQWSRDFALQTQSSLVTQFFSKCLPFLSKQK